MFLAKSIAQKAEKLRIDELCFMDNNKEKLRIYGGMASHVANLLCPKMKFVLTTDSIEAVKDADDVITTIRVGEDEMRAKDERIALNHGVLGQRNNGSERTFFCNEERTGSCRILRAYQKIFKTQCKSF